MSQMTSGLIGGMYMQPIWCAGNWDTAVEVCTHAHGVQSVNSVLLHTPRLCR